MASPSTVAVAKFELWMGAGVYPVGHSAGCRSNRNLMKNHTKLINNRNWKRI
jgi:hypothetical protein